MKNFGVYILQSEKTGKYYIGSTDNIDRRFGEHNSGKVVSTKSFRPWVLKVFIECSTLTIAKSSEYKLKKYKRRDIVEKVISDRVFPWNY